MFTYTYIADKRAWWSRQFVLCCCYQNAEAITFFAHELCNFVAVFKLNIINSISFHQVNGTQQIPNYSGKNYVILCMHWMKRDMLQSDRRLIVKLFKMFNVKMQTSTAKESYIMFGATMLGHIMGRHKLFEMTANDCCRCNLPVNLTKCNSSLVGTLYSWERNSSITIANNVYDEPTTTHRSRSFKIVNYDFTIKFKETNFDGYFTEAT